MATSAGQHPELNEQVCASYVRQTVAGVFFAPLELTEDKDRINQSVINALEASGIPVVLLDRDIVASPQRSHFDLVGIDNRSAGFLAANHLIRQYSIPPLKALGVRPETKS